MQLLERWQKPGCLGRPVPRRTLHKAQRRTPSLGHTHTQTYIYITHIHKTHTVTVSQAYA